MTPAQAAMAVQEGALAALLLSMAVNPPAASGLESGNTALRRYAGLSGKIVPASEGRHALKIGAGLKVGAPLQVRPALEIGAGRQIAAGHVGRRG